ncbi:MAG: amidase [Usitatibacter sp.]
MSDPALLCARDLEHAFGAHTLSPVEHTRATLARIESLNVKLNAYRIVDAEGALQSARASEQRWMRGAPLSRIDGVTFGVKDILLARGQLTCFGSKALAPVIADQDAPTAARLREQGCVFLGKTTTSEFAWKGTADSPLSGIVRNPIDPQRTTGGSSGGAAVAAAAGMGNFQLGTDGGGSVRIPASFCGLAAMKATFGRVSAWPAGPMMTLSNVGPIARSMDDVARMLQAIARPDPRDWYALPPATLDFDRPLEAAGLKLGLYIGKSHPMLDPQVEARIREVAERLKQAGASVQEIELPLEGGLDILLPHWNAGALHMVSALPEEKRALVDPGLRAAAERGKALTIEQYYRATFLRQRFGEAMQAALRPFDAIITPTLPIVAFEAGREWPAGADCESWLEWASYVFPFNLSRQPAASVPVGVCSEGLPIGAQVAGLLNADEKVVGIARIVERLMAR